MVEAARALSTVREHLDRTVRFVAFGVKESGLVGAWSYTHRHADELDHTLQMVNKDVVGRPTEIGISGFEDLVPVVEEVAGRVAAAGRQEPLNVSDGIPGWGSDHLPFTANGVPNLGIDTEGAGTARASSRKPSLPASCWPTWSS